MATENNGGDESRTIPEKLAQAQIIHLKAEAAKFRTEAKWQRGWRAFVKPVTIGLAGVTLVVFYWQFYFDTLEKSMRFKLQNLTEILSELDADKLRLNADIDKHSFENEMLRLDRVRLRVAQGILESDKEKFILSVEDLKARNNICDQQVATVQAALQRLVESAKPTAEYLFTPEENKQARRDIILRELFLEEYDKGFNNHFKMAGSYSSRWLEEYRRKAGLNDSDEIIAAVDGVFGGYILFTQKGIYTDYNKGNSMSYGEMIDKEVSKHRGEVIVDGRFSLSNIKFGTTSDERLQEFILHLQEVVEIHRGLFI